VRGCLKAEDHKQHYEEAEQPYGWEAALRSGTSGMSQVDSLRDCSLYCSSLYTRIHGLCAHYV
jgi:hypothetical protein